MHGSVGSAIVKTGWRICSTLVAHHRGSAEERRGPCGGGLPSCRAAATGAALALALLLAVRAEGSADRASRTLNFEVRRDRARDEALGGRAADKARSSPAPAASPGARQIDEDRAAVGPDVGRPEVFGRTPQPLLGTGYDST